ncbi:restriction endonuclease subunit S [Streptomyces sp. NPDC090023]|uniref:restriction endonuclease subunit S n=1 Tax=unclassified Streptomyces TaxID=2593676 RepID=UPI0038061206
MSEGGIPSELPEGWSWSSLGEVAEVIRGVTYKKQQASASPASGYLPLLRATNIVGELNTSEELVYVPERLVSASQRIRVGDIIVASSSGSSSVVGKSAALPRQWAGTWGAFCACVRPLPPMEPSFLALFLQGDEVRRRWSRKARGSNINNLKVGDMKETPVPVPPLEEQRRIVAALEEQLSRLDAASGVLDVSERRIEQYLQAALHEMTSGHDLVSLRDVLDSGLTNGRSVPTRAGGFPVLRLTALSDTYVDLSQSKEGDWEESDAKPFFVRRGDFLIARGNGSLSLVGRGSLVADVPSPVAYPDTMIRACPDPRKIIAEYLRTIWSSLAVRRQIESKARTTAGIYKVNQKILGAIEFPLPELTIQRALCDQWSVIEQQARHLAQTVSVSKKRSASLRRSLLAEAFAGRLTSQDPADEPAEVLLARIRAESETAVRRAPARRRALSATTPVPTAPPPSPADVPTLATATQPTLDLEIPS